MNQIMWNKPRLEEFLRLACLTEIEEHILKLKIAGYSVEQQAELMCMSRSNVNVITRRISDKYDSVQPFSDILPQRNQSARERKSK